MKNDGIMSWYSFKPADYRASERYLGMTLQERGGAMGMETWCWCNRSFPFPEGDDFRVLAQILQCSVDEARAVWPRLKPLSEPVRDDTKRGFLPYVEKKRLAQEDRSRHYAERGKSGANKRWRGGRANEE